MQLFSRREVSKDPNVEPHMKPSTALNAQLLTPNSDQQSTKQSMRPSTSKLAAPPTKKFVNKRTEMFQTSSAPRFRNRNVQTSNKQPMKQLIGMSAKVFLLRYFFNALIS